MLSLIKLLRPKHWIKNAFVVAPLIFTLKFVEIESVFVVLKVFIAFCCIASSIYVFNDILDKEKDKHHPKKKFRPIASGKVSILQAVLAQALLFVVACFIAYNINIKTLIVFSKT